MKNKQTLIMACCGAANVGQLSNRLARELVENGYGSAFCLAGIGAHHRGFVKAATENDTVLIDGCSIGCGKLIFESAEVPLKKYLILTELGIEKAVGGRSRKWIWSWPEKRFGISAVRPCRCSQPLRPLQAVAVKQIVVGDKKACSKLSNRPALFPISRAYPFTAMYKRG